MKNLKEELQDLIPQEVLDSWPNCEVPDCPNKCCLSLNSAKCFPHTMGLPLNYTIQEEKE